MTLTDHELETLVIAGEGERVEFKPSAKQKNEIRDAICAFANDLPGSGLPGVVFVGLNDDGTCANLPITDELLRELADLRTDGNILPLPTMSVEKRTVLGCEVAVIIVEPSPNPPVRVRGRGMIRVGSRRGVATLEEEQRLVERARAGVRAFDVQPVPGSTLDDLDRVYLREVFLPAVVGQDLLEANDRPLEAQLQALDFLATDGEATVVGILVAGIDPRRFLPGAYLQLVRFDGTSLGDPIRSAGEATGRIAEQIRFCEEWMEAQIDVSVEPGRTEVRRASYPMQALREFVRNAVMHRSYEGTNAPVHVRWFSDRIEILSPGGPYGKVTADNFGQPGVTDLRNPNLATAMRYLGLAQRFGVGIEIARKALAENGNPPPEFNATDTHVLVTLRRRP